MATFIKRSLPSLLNPGIANVALNRVDIPEPDGTVERIIFQYCVNDSL